MRFRVRFERLWRTINDELLDDIVFDSEEHLKEELMKYVIYFNGFRPHSSLSGNKPRSCIDNLNEKEILSTN